MSMSSSLFASLTVLRSVTLSLTHHPHRCSIRRSASNILFHPPISLDRAIHGRKCTGLSCSTFVEHLESEPLSTSESDEQLEFYNGSELQELDFEHSLASIDLKHLGTPVLEIKDLDELPEQWRRSKLAWLCKELPGHKPGTLVRVLNAQRKWVRQDDATYLAVHCMRIRENETGFRVYKWMMQQHWYRFDFSLSTKLADYLGKERKFAKCREVFDDIINQGHIPSESTFHILIVAYLSAPISGCLEEACGIYNRMIQLGGYRPRLSLHNSLFKALVSKSGVSSKHYLKQAEFVYHNLVTTGLEIHKDIYGGLVWLHSYQDIVDKERIEFLMKEMRRAGFDEGKEVLLSILRACSKEGNLEELESTWLKLSKYDGGVPPQAFVYKMEAYAKVGSPLKCLEIFREMQERSSLTNIVAYHKIMDILCKAQEVELAESIMMDLIQSNLKPIMPSFIDLMNMYFNLSLHDKLEATYFRCLEKCTPNHTVYSIYLDSLVRVGRLDRADEIFNEMQTSGTIGINARSCNIILSGYLSSGNHVKAEKIYEMMCQKKYDVDPPSMDKLDNLLSLSRKEVQKPISMKLSQEQREILVGLLLGGLEIESDEERENHRILFSFNKNSNIHQILRRHIYEKYHEWLHTPSKLSNEDEDIPYIYCTISHSYFGFYADQFWPLSRPVIPKLIHRWLSARTLAYWYMFGGHRSSSGDILLKLKGSRVGVEKVVKTFKEKSIDCRVKSKGRVYWIAFIGTNSSLLWKLIEPYILDDLIDILQPDGLNLEDELLGTQDINFDSSADSAKEASEDIDILG